MAKRKRRSPPKPVDPAVAEEIARLEEAQDVLGLQGATTEGGRGRRDLARRALYRLRRAGVEVAKAESPLAARRARLAAAGETLPASRVTAPDAMGTVIVWLVLGGGRGGGLRVAQAVISEIEGVEQIKIQRPGRSQWRRMWRHATDNREFLVADVTAQEAASWLHGDLAHDPQGREARASVSDLRKMVAEAEAVDAANSEGPPTVYGLLEESPDEGEVSAVVDLLELGALKTWRPGDATLGDLWREVEEAETTVLELTEQQRIERRERIVDKHVDAWLSTERRAILRRRLERTARVVLGMGDPSGARSLLAAARGIVDERLDGSSLPWVREMVARWIRPVEPEAPNPSESLDRPRSDQ